VLALSFLFYEAQRSGKLGPNNRIPWRGDSVRPTRGGDQPLQWPAPYRAARPHQAPLPRSQTPHPTDTTAPTPPAPTPPAPTPPHPSQPPLQPPAPQGLTDRTDSGRDVTGGWYDAGDNVKFNLPMAWTSAVLAWSVYEFPDGYKNAKQYETALANIKWVTDYFIKAVGDGNEIVGQVGNGGQDHCECQLQPGEGPGPLGRGRGGRGRVLGVGAAAMRGPVGWAGCGSPKHALRLLF
jgi:hypothetical protein